MMPPTTPKSEFVRASKWRGTQSMLSSGKVLAFMSMATMETICMAISSQTQPASAANGNTRIGAMMKGADRNR